MLCRKSLETRYSDIFVFENLRRNIDKELKFEYACSYIVKIHSNPIIRSDSFFGKSLANLSRKLW